MTANDVKTVLQNQVGILRSIEYAFKHLKEFTTFKKTYMEEIEAAFEEYSFWNGVDQARISREITGAVQAIRNRGEGVTYLPGCPSSEETKNSR